MISGTAPTLDLIGKALGFQEKLDPSELPTAWMIDDMHVLELHLRDGAYIVCAVLAENLAEDAPEYEAVLEISADHLGINRPVVAFETAGARLLLWKKLANTTDEPTIRTEINSFLAELKVWYARLPQPISS